MKGNASNSTKSPPPKDHAREAFAAKAKETRVLLFDIDGTLVLTGGAGQRAMARAFEELFAISDAFRDIEMAGRTDTWILSNAAAAHGILPNRLPAFQSAYLGLLEQELESPNPKKAVMPGVRALLDALAARDHTFLALLTGNYEKAARLKLEHFDLWRYFSCGAFADDAADRNSLVPKALERVHACGGPTVRPADVIVVGDTPHDVACALAAGARAVGVATGPFSVEELRGSGAEIVFEDLSDTDAFLKLL
jgi:phosphoglycolate phosphatase